MRVVQVPLLEDNISYLLVCEKTNVAAAVDPSEPEKVLLKAKDEGVTITHILTTHHHWDHAQGNPGMVDALGPSLVVVGGDDRVDALTQKVGQNDELKIGEIDVKVHSTPCHTKGHVLYFCTDSSDHPPAVFTGDTQFVGGCGRFFEGTGDQMNYALNTVISSLPGETYCYCGHEYTISNLKFARDVEPQNEPLKAKFEWATEQRKRNKSTIPSTVNEEKLINPFFRVKEATVRAYCGASKDSTDAEVMDLLRQKKNSFKSKN